MITEGAVKVDKEPWTADGALPVGAHEVSVGKRRWVRVLVGSAGTV